VHASTLIAAIGFSLATSGAALALVQSGPVQLEVKVGVQNTFQHAGVDRIEWVQERNELAIQGKYDFIARGRQAFGLREATLNLFYRGRYDSIFDVREVYGRRGYRRDDFRFPEGEIPRELFLDLRFTGALSALSARVGRQQIVWGEADLFRSLDVVNPLRLDQNGILGDDFADYREPLWIAKLFYSIGRLGPVDEGGLEMFYSPNSRPLTNRLVYGEEFRIKLDNPLERKNRRPTQLPFRRVRYPWELSRDGPDYGETFDQADVGFAKGDVVYLNRNDFPTATLSKQGGMAGARLLGKTFGNLDFTLNYLFKRAELPGSAVHFRDVFDPAISTNGSFNVRADQLASALAAEATLDTDGNGIPQGREALIDRCLRQNKPTFLFGSLRGNPGNAFTVCLDKVFWYPWTHIFGGTLTYNDDRFTGLIFRLEESFSTREPRNGVRPAAGVRAGQFPTADDFATNLMRETQVWRSMVGFDSLRALPWIPFTKNDPWFLTFQFLNEYYAHWDHQLGLTGSITDRMNQWNPLLTLLATGYFLNSRLKPVLAAAYDVNAAFPVFWLQAEYFVSRRWTVRAGEVLYAGSQHAESFLFLNHYTDRDTLFLRVSFLLL
jgi:hypothetical protein